MIKGYVIGVSASRFLKQVAVASYKSMSRRNKSDMIRVTVAEGEIEGRLKCLPSGNSYASFKGIPYATPPVGKLRFKAPLPPIKWTGVRDGSKHGNVCPNLDFITGEKVQGSDDCLYLNVYSPNVKSSNTPVIVWIHGGGFYSGSGDYPVYGPEYLLEENLILVTINYRLEALGFLCLDTEEVPGNAGLKDQVAALKWVKDNIHNFGGDSDNVTVMGGSAGAVSASYHMVSPMSKGLVNRVIAQSGCLLSEWAITEGGRERAFRLGKYLGLETNDSNKLLEYLQSLPVNELSKVTFPTITNEEKLRGLPICFGPTIEKFDNESTFINKPVRELLNTTTVQNVDILLGYTSKEGLINIGHSLKKAESFDKHFDRKIHKEIIRMVSPDTLNKITNKVKTFYFGDKPYGEGTLMGVIDLDTDYNFSVPTIELSRILSSILSKKSCFLYRFSIDSDMNMMKMNLSGGRDIKGACHADDIFYIFKTPLNIDKDSQSWIAMKRTVRLWANFAKYGNPTPNTDDLINAIWLPVERNKLNYMEITTNELIPQVDPDKERFNLWMDVRKMAFADTLKSKY